MPFCLIRMLPTPNLPEGRPGRSRATKCTAEGLWPLTYTTISQWKAVIAPANSQRGLYKAGPRAPEVEGLVEATRAEGVNTEAPLQALLQMRVRPYYANNNRWAVVRATVPIREVCSPYGLVERAAKGWK